ncbi:MAG: tyrosyl-tRNA synthetase [uncultured bacterium]|nr:MAG: tyrosyl-tRNA synthetase [uncultured bacterium]
MDQIDQTLKRGVTNIIPGKKELEKLLRSGKKLNIYLGVEPTATKIHIGHAVPLRKLQEFVELGHNVTFVIGDFTALIGDTSDKDKERPSLTYQEIKQNFKTYKEQASKILDFSKAAVRFNSEWLKKLGFTDIVKLAQHFSVGDFVGRELIKKRLGEGKRVGLHEFLYPLMQGYDSYFMDTDIQIGGADQTFNMQAGRTLQKDLRNKESFVLVTGYLTGTDGRKMSKSWGNAIWINDPADEMYGKTMSLQDDLILEYFANAIKPNTQKLKEVQKRLEAGENPMKLKKELAFALVSEFHNEKAAKAAEDKFKFAFQEKKPEFNIRVNAGSSIAITIAPFTSLGSNSEAKRLIKQKAVDVNGKIVDNPTYIVKPGDEIKVGSRTFLKAK